MTRDQEQLARLMRECEAPAHWIIWLMTVGAAVALTLTLILSIEGKV